MRRGVIGLPVGDVPRMQPYRRTRTEKGTDLVDRIAVSGVQRTRNGTDITEGRGATQSVGMTEAVDLSSDDIAVEEREGVQTRQTSFASVPGEFVVVSDSRGTFLFDLIADATPGTVERATLDVDGLVGALPDPTLWKVGFYDRDGGAENGVVHGDDVLGDDAFGDALAGLPKNQVGLNVTMDGTDYKLNVARSGFVELYRPSDVSTAEFVEFLREHVVPHASLPD